MANVKEAAKDWKPTQTKNVSELEYLDLELELFEQIAIDKDGKEFKYRFVEVDGDCYRVPYKVIGDIKEILQVNPKTQKVKVLKRGEGIKTNYTTLP